MIMNREEILHSLIVQGSMLESDTGSYIAILESSKKEMLFNDPLEEMIAGVFNMCISGTIDPWSIDIGAFSRIFSSMVDRNFRDFYVAGYLMQNAWKILSLKSDEAVSRRIRNEMEDPVEDTEPDDSGNIRNMWDPLELREPVIHREKRKVFLVELLDVMKDAYQFSEKKKHERRFVVEHPEGDIDSVFEKLHPEEPEKEAIEILDVIRSMASDKIDLDSIPMNPGVTGQSLLVYCMFLARDREIDIFQEHPFGPIELRVLNELRR